MKKIINIFIASLSILFAAAACVEEEMVKIEFNEPTYSMTVGQVLDLSTEIVTNAGKKIEFSTSDEKVVYVSASGKLTAISEGEATVTATIDDVKASCTVVVSELKAESIVLNTPEAITADGVSVSVKAEVSPAGFNMENLEWTLTAKDDDGSFAYEKIGAAEYSVKASTYVKGATLTVTVKDKNSDVSTTAVISMKEKMAVATKITLQIPEQLTAGDDIWGTITASVLPDEYDTENLSWEFEPSVEELEYKTEKISSSEYKVSFPSFKSNAVLTVVVSDVLSNTMAQGRIKVLERPTDGVTSMKLSPSTLVVPVGTDPVALQLVCEPADYDAALLTWSTSDQNVVTVDKGVVTFVGEGKAEVKVKDAISGKEAACAVVVTSAGVEDIVRRIALSKVNLSMRVGEEAVQLTASCYNESDELIENYANLIWSATPMTGENGAEINVVEVSQLGVVTAKNAGSTQIVVTDKINPYVKATCNVVVAPAEIKVTEVRLSPDNAIIKEGESFTITARVLPEDAADKSLTFKSSDESVATVTDKGVVTAMKPGTATITAASSNGVKGTCQVVVAEEVWVYLDEQEISLHVGDERQLTATITPEDAQDKTVVWESTAPDVATVKDGLVKAVSEGIAVIKATSNGVTAECKVNVEAGDIDFEITLEPSDNQVLTKGLQQDRSFKLNAYYMRYDNNKDYIPVNKSWVSSDPSVATVDQDGNVTAVIEHIDMSGIENGKKVTITHVVDHKEKSIEIVVVKALPEQVIMTAVPSVDGVEYRMLHRESFTFKAKVLPEKASQEVWFSGGDYLQIPNNTFPATQLGDVEITAYAADNTDARLKFTITVLPVVLTDMTMSATSLDLVEGAHASLSVSFTPSSPSYSELKWSSSDEAVATVDKNGVITAVGAGNAVITVLQEENQMSRTCQVNVTEAKAIYKVGDYYYSTGKVSSRADEPESTHGKVIGVVFSTENPAHMGGAALASAYPDCVNGYVVGMVEYTGQDFGGVSTYNGHGYYKSLGYDAAAIVAEDKANGYGNSQAHAGLNASKPDFCQMFNGSEGVIAAHKASVPAPASASAWYVPSFKEMQMLSGNMTAVNSALTAAGGDAVALPYDSDNSLDELRSSDWYWTSTIRGEWYERGQSYDHYKHPFDISRNGWTATMQTSAQCRVRVILAF